MGRKSTTKAKGKEKKMKWKEEQAILSASVKLVNAANSLEDPLNFLPSFRKFEKNGLEVNIECKKVGDLPDDDVQCIFNLLKENMEALYEDSEWGWKDKEKFEEMTEDKAWYMLPRNKAGELVGFVHFRFDIEEGDEVIYCYEIQLVKSVRRKGLGKFLMIMLELLANKTEMKKVMLTTFKHNPDGPRFFKEKLKYSVDEISPEDFVFEDAFTYEILSKTIKQKDKVDVNV